MTSSNKELRRRAEDLARQAGEDALTGLPNRRRVDEFLAARVRTISVALVDVDHFKRVNDTFSHAIGDSVLKQLAVVMRSNCRPRDLAARLSGEEFAALFDGASESDVAHAAERLREAIERFDWASIAAGGGVRISVCEAVY